MVKKQDILNNIETLRTQNGKFKGKWLRNLRLYYYSMNVSLENYSDGPLVGYWNLMDNTGYSSTINENVIQSCIDSLTSQLASKNTRPYFSTLNGTYMEKRIAKQAQLYFDQLYDEQNVTQTVTDAFKDACIFGNGWIYVDPFKRKIEKALPWQVFTLHNEEAYGNITRIYYERKDYPTTSIPGYKGKETKVTYGVYYDIVNHVYAEVINNDAKLYEWNNDTLPFHNIKYISSVYGKDTTSVPDILYGIQMKLDDLYHAISEAINVNPASVFIVPQGSDTKTTSLTNKIGQILTYKPVPDISRPIDVWQPNFIADQYLMTVEQLKKDAYELVGISQLSAQSKKPSGLDSGKALQTMNDIESERFEVQYKNVIRAYVDIARICIKVFTGNVLPEDKSRLNITWEDVVRTYDKMKIQFSSLDVLSKDPTARMEEVQQLANMGALNAHTISYYFDLPDSERGYSYANNSYNAVLAVINQAIVNEDFNIPEYIPLDMLKQEIVETMLSLKAVENEQNITDIERLKKLYENADVMANQMADQANQQAQQADEQAFQQNLNREAQQIYNTKMAEQKAAMDAMIEQNNALMTNNV